MIAQLPPDFISRPPTSEDAQGIYDMICASDTALVGAPDIDLDYVTDDWQRPGFSLTDDARVVTTGQGQIIGYEIVGAVRENGHIELDGYVHPDFLNQGIGTYLLRWAEARAYEHLTKIPVEVTALLQAGTYGHDEGAHRLFQAEGFQIVRHFWRMAIDMTAPPPEPVLLPEIMIRTFVPDQDAQEVWETVRDTFADHWEFEVAPFEEWKMRLTDPDFDPLLWFLAIAGERIIGVALGSYRLDSGWINTVGVRRDWRRHGIATALLYHAFGEYYRRGKLTVGLGVDAQSLTGATHVYEQAGMHITQIYDTFQKVLRPAETDQVVPNY